MILFLIFCTNTWIYVKKYSKFDEDNGNYIIKSGNASFSSAEVWKSPTIQEYYKNKGQTINILPPINSDDTKILIELDKAETETERRILLDQFSPEVRKAYNNYYNK